MRCSNKTKKKKMSGNFWKKLFLLSSTFFIFLNSLSVYSSNQNENELKQDLTVRAVHKILNYLQNHSETINDDVLLGVILAKSNLNWLINRCRDIPSMLTELLVIVRMCDRILEENPSRNPSIMALSTIWENGAEDISYGNLEPVHDKFVLPKVETCRDIQDFLTKKIPDDSDACIEELFDSDCHPSIPCWSSEWPGNYYQGYATTHLLIYSQIAHRLNCAMKNEKKFFDVKSRIRKLCRSMLMEARALHDQPYFLLVRDLFLEQIALCGVEGYAEFASEDWRKEVLEWQSEKGCFGHDMFFSLCPLGSSSNRNKRTDYFIDGCHTHVTAVALVALAFHLRYKFSPDFVSNHSQKPLISLN